MPFPFGTSVLDTFTGADESPLSVGGVWSGPLFVGDGRLARFSNAVRQATAGTYAEGYRAAATFGRDQVAFAQLTTIPSVGSYVAFMLRVTDPNSSVDGYEILFERQATAVLVTFKSYANESGTAIGTEEESIAITLANGDWLGVSANGTGLAAYHSTNGVTWAEIATRTDSAVTGAGYIGLYLDNDDAQTTRIDNFGGGTIALVLEDSGQSHVVDSPTLTAGIILAVADATHGQAADGVALTQANTLVLADALQAHVADNVALTVVGTLTVADAIQGHTSENVVLTQAQVLAIADALQAHFADIITLSVPGEGGPGGRMGITIAIHVSVGL